MKIKRWFMRSYLILFTLFSNRHNFGKAMSVVMVSVFLLMYFQFIDIVKDMDIEHLEYIFK